MIRHLVANIATLHKFPDLIRPHGFSLSIRGGIDVRTEKLSNLALRGDLYLIRDSGFLRKEQDTASPMKARLSLSIILVITCIASFLARYKPGRHSVTRTAATRSDKSYLFGASLFGQLMKNLRSSPKFNPRP